MKEKLLIAAIFIICFQSVAQGAIKGGGEASGSYQIKIESCEEFSLQGGGESSGS